MHIQPEKLWRPDIMVIMVMIMVIVLEARYYGKSIFLKPDMIFVKTFTRPEFLGPKFYTKCVNLNNGKFATKQREFTQYV